MEKRLSRPLKKERVLRQERAVEALQAFYDLTIDWPFRPVSHTGLGTHFSAGNSQGGPSIGCRIDGGYPSHMDPLFRELVSEFHSERELRRAEGHIDSLIDRLMIAIR